MRNKLTAILLGSSGIGLIGLYQSLTSLVESATNLGLTSSAVRELGSARGNEDPSRASFVSSVLRRSTWILGSAGWLITGLLAVPLSVWAFSAPDRAREITALGGLVLLASITGARNAILQGHQRLRDLALVGIFSSLGGLILSVTLYWFYGEKGIIPALLGTALISFAFASYFAAKIPVQHPSYDWRTYWTELRSLATLGFAFMLGGILIALVAVIIRALVVRQLGIDANGLYQAAAGLTGMFAGFILNAMALDFFPRLSSVAGDNSAMTRLVNEQTEIGVLLALPGLVATLAFAPWILRLLYSPEFLPASPLLIAMFVGCFAQVVGWPLGFIARAKGAVRWMIIPETFITLLHLALAILLLPRLGLAGVAYAFTISWLCYIFVMWGVARRLCNFRWSAGALRLIGFAATVTIFTVAASMLFDAVPAALLGFASTVLAFLFTARGIAHRLGPDHRIVMMLAKVPGWRLLRSK